MSEPQSYNEAILQSIIDGTPYEDPNPYPSRIETLLLELKEVIESGGDPELAQRVSAIEAQLFSTIANVATNTDSGSMDLYSKDLNTIITSGFYNAMTCTNAPADYCTLIVTGYYLTGYCTQIAMDVTTGKFYTRTQSNSTWGAWIEKANTTDLAAKADASAVYTKTETDSALATKQDALSAAQLSAVDSGITSAKVSTYDSYGTWEEYECLFSSNTQVSSRFDVDNSSIKVRVNRALKRCIANISMVAIANIDSNVNVFNIGTFGNDVPNKSELRPNASPRAVVWAQAGGFTAVIAKTTTTDTISFFVADGTISSGATFTCQLSWDFA